MKTEILGLKKYSEKAQKVIYDKLQGFKDYIDSLDEFSIKKEIENMLKNNDFFTSINHVTFVIYCTGNKIVGHVGWRGLHIPEVDQKIKNKYGIEFNIDVVSLPVPEWVIDAECDCGFGGYDVLYILKSEKEKMVNNFIEKLKGIE